MKDKTLYIFIGLLCLAFFGFGLMAGYSLAPKPTIETKTEFVNVPTIKVDTLLKKYTEYRSNTKVVHDTTVIERIVREKDTVYQAKPFTSHFDTTATGGRVRLDYLFPENMIRNLIVEPRQIKVIQSQTIYKERSVWIDILTHVGAAGIGYGFGYIVGAK